MKTKNILYNFNLRFTVLGFFTINSAFAAGIPEPGLVMYGAVRNTAAGNVRLTSGTLSWTITPPSGSPITVSTPLTDISGQYCFALQVPFESVVGSSTLSPNALSLNSATTSYIRTNVFLTVNGTNYHATISAPAIGNFTFNTATRGQISEVDLTVSAPGVGAPLLPNPNFASVQRTTGGQFRLTVNGNIGQNYNLLASTDLIHWTNIMVFTCTNTSTVVYDPSSTNFPIRFYKMSQ